MDLDDRQQLEEQRHDQRMELETWRDQQRQRRDRQISHERQEHRRELEEMRHQARVDLADLERRFKPEELDLLFDDYCRRRNIDLQYLKHDLAIRQEDQKAAYETELNFLYRRELIAVEGYLYRKLIDVFIARLLGVAGLTREEVDYAIGMGIQDLIGGRNALEKLQQST